MNPILLTLGLVPFHDHTPSHSLSGSHFPQPTNNTCLTSSQLKRNKMLAAEGFEELNPPHKRSQHYCSLMNKTGKTLAFPGSRLAGPLLFEGTQLTSPALTVLLHCASVQENQVTLSLSKHHQEDGPLCKINPKTSLPATQSQREMISQSPSGVIIPIPGQGRGRWRDRDGGLTINSPTTLDAVLASQNTCAMSIQLRYISLTQQFLF